MPLHVFMSLFTWNSQSAENIVVLWTCFSNIVCQYTVGSYGIDRL